MAIPHRTSLQSVSTAVAVRLCRGYWMRFGAQSKRSAGSDLGLLRGLLRMDSGFGHSLSRKPTSFLARAIRLQPPKAAPKL
jgi:hypothetical protein